MLRTLSNGITILEISLAVESKVTDIDKYVHQRSNNPTSRYSLKKTENFCPSYRPVCKCSVALFIIDQNWEQHKCSSIRERGNKVLYLDTKEQKGGAKLSGVLDTTVNFQGTVVSWFR